jgi:aminomethyltransferase
VCEAPDAIDVLQYALTNDLHKVAPGRAQYTHLLDENDASVLDDIIVWWIADDIFDVMPNASNTDRVRAAIGGDETTGERAVLAVQGPRAKERLTTVFPRHRRSAASVSRPQRGRGTTVSSPAPVTPVRPESRSPSPTPGRQTCGRPSPPPA